MIIMDITCQLCGQTKQAQFGDISYRGKVLCEECVRMIKEYANEKEEYPPVAVTENKTEKE